MASHGGDHLVGRGGVREALDEAAVGGHDVGEGAVVDDVVGGAADALLAVDYAEGAGGLGDGGGVAGDAGDARVEEGGVLAQLGLDVALGSTETKTGTTRSSSAAVRARRPAAVAVSEVGQMSGQAV